MKAAIWAALAMATTCLGCFASTDPASARMLAKAEDILRGENVIPGREFVNSSGTNKPTEQSWAFSTICKLAEKPLAIFRRLAESGSYYGMIGLRKFSPETFRTLLAEFRGEPTVYLLSHDAFVLEERGDFLDRLARDEKGATFESLIWPNIPEWVKTIRVRQPGKNP